MDPETQVIRTEPAVSRFQNFELAINSPEREARSIVVEQRTFRVGTHLGNDLVLEDEAVSRYHCEILVDELGFRIRDLGSTNGTFYDGRRVLDAYLLPTASLKIGRTRLQFRALDAVTEQQHQPRQGLGAMIGQSLPMLELYDHLERVAHTELTALIEGESGTGKELAARAIHDASQRAGGPFVVFDCSAVSGSLMESELFGHEKGAFTGAFGQRKGCIEEASGGTLFLDEIGELPAGLQPKLLRALESREIRPVGGSQTRGVDVRFIAATNRDLAREVNSGGFRANLYYRLAVARIRLPPLSKRPDDIPLLVRHMLREIFVNAPKRSQSIFDTISEATWQRLCEHRWKGNVRELRNVVERAVTLSKGSPDFTNALYSLQTPAPVSSTEETEDDPPDAAGEFVVRVPNRGSMLDQKAAIITAFEKAYIGRLLSVTKNNISEAATRAQCDRSYLRRLVKKYGF